VSASEARPAAGEITIVPFTTAHLEEAVGIERRSFSDPWTRGMFRSEIQLFDTSYARAALQGGRLAGYMLAVMIPDEAHLGNVAVHPDARRQGIAQRLLDDLLAECRRTGVRRVTLEVRESNQNARNFYYKNEFIDVAIRKNYYRNPVEDAIVMLRSLPEDRPR
jgi:[ribosomal protein S18]-alanine N-acetyltransferase